MRGSGGVRVSRRKLAPNPAAECRGAALYAWAVILCVPRGNAQTYLVADDGKEKRILITSTGHLSSHPERRRTLFIEIFYRL